MGHIIYSPQVIKHGFLKGLRCETQLVTNVEEMKRGQDKKAQYDHLIKTDAFSSVVSFAIFSPTCGRMPLPALSLWPGRWQYRPRLVDDRIGGGPSSAAPRSRNPPTGRRRDSPISSSLFSQGPPCA